MTYQTVALGVVLGLAAYNIAAGIIEIMINQYHSYKLNRILDEMDWSDFNEPVKATRKKKETQKKSPSR
jgi:hypothetical protein